MYSSFLSGFQFHILHLVVRIFFACRNLNSDPLSALPGSQESIHSFVTWMLTLLDTAKEVRMPTLPPSWSCTWLLNFTLLIKKPNNPRQTNKNQQTNKTPDFLLLLREKKLKIPGIGAAYWSWNTLMLSSFSEDFAGPKWFFVACTTIKLKKNNQLFAHLWFSAQGNHPHVHLHHFSPWKRTGYCSHLCLITVVQQNPFLKLPVSS